MRRLTLLLILLLTASNCLALQKNVASQKWTIFAFDRTDNTAKTGDLGQITGSIWKDGVQDVIADTYPTELAHGYYEFDLDQEETNGDYLVIDAVSSTGNIQVVGCPMALWTTAPYFSVLSIDASGRLDIIKVAGTTQTANDMSGDVDTLISVLGALNTAAASGVPTDSDEIMAYVKQLINDTRTTIFHGRGLSAYGVVSTATSVTEFAAVGLDAPHHTDDYFNGWWIYILDADQGAPLHEWRQVSNYAETGGVVTHAAFTVQLEVGDQVLIVNPAEHASIAVDTLTKASGDGDLAAILLDTAAQDTAGEWDTLNATLDGKLDTIVTAVGNIETDTAAQDTAGEWDTLMATADGKLDTIATAVGNIETDTEAWDTAGEATALLADLAVDLVKIHGSAITETTSGRFATNWNTFFDNADSDTAKTLDDIGGAAGLEVDVTKIHGTALTETNSGDLAESFTFFFDVEPVTSKTVDDVGGASNLEVDVTKIHGTAITESTAGRIAGNFSTFWDNADAATAKVVDNVGASAAGGGSPLVLSVGNVGNYKEDSTIVFVWRTIDQGGAAVDPSTVGVLKIYKEDSDVEVTADTGITDTRGFDGITGVHVCVIDLSANTFYARDKDYSIVLTGAVVDSQTTTAVIATFSIEKRYVDEFDRGG